VTAEKVLQLLRSSIGRFQAVIVEKFFALLQVAQSVNINATPVVAGFTIGRARMVNPACLIAIYAGVDNRPVFEGKEKGMMRMLRVVRRKILRRLPGNAFAGVFNNAGPLANSTGGKDSLAVNS